MAVNCLTNTRHYLREKTLCLQQLAALQRGAKCQIQNHNANAGKHAVHQRNAAGDLGGNAGQLHRLAKNLAVAEIAQKRIGKHIQQQAAEGAAGNGQQVFAPRRGFGVQLVQLEHIFGAPAAGKANDEL